ncbi:hypothetical protein [Sphingomonas carotinifaciens]|uniref:hypothetical protein n=1 Tax=Sphingomonas carotinifaciens TaxID=1166323 RepID=UPI000DD672F1|nr:hypothetical protein [Sphingomonas carotinifaciens]
MKTEVLQRLPDWPARMTADIAAVYMSVSKSTFLTRFGDLGVREGSNVFWARPQLDRIIAKQFSIKQPHAQARDEDNTWDDFR